MPIPTNPTTQTRTNLIILAAAIYLFLPFDWIPVLGMLGDLGALAAAVTAARSGVPTRLPDQVDG